MSPIYLDNNATTRPLERVVQAMNAALAETWANPSSMHRPGQQARQAIELARKHCADLIGVRPRYITFTGSGTESLDLAIRGSLLAQSRVGGARRLGPGSILTSKVEHSALRHLAEALEREEGTRVHWAAIGPGGVVDVEQIESVMKSDPQLRLVSIQWANNETGAVQPVHEIARLCRARGILFHCDATQWIGKMPATGSEQLDADLITYSPHKFHGPKGVGVLYARAGVATSPLIHGEQELGRRGGTENVPGLVGAGVAAEAALAWLADPGERKRLEALRDSFEAAVLMACPEATLNAADAPHGRLWNTSNIAFSRLEAEALLLLLSERGVCASAGAACSSGSLDPSPVLQAMGIPAELAHGSLRFSLSRFTTLEEIGLAVETIRSSVSRLAGSMRAL